MNVLENVLQKLGERNATVAADYNDIVKKIVDGNEPDAISVAEVLAVAGKSEENLRDDVVRLIERRRLRVALDAKPAAEERTAAIDAALQKIEAKREAFDKKCDDERWPLDGEREQQQALIVAASDAQRKLCSSCNNPEILTRSVGITKELEAIDAEIHRLRDDRERFSTMAVDLNREATSVEVSDGRRIHSNEESETYGGYCHDLDEKIAKQSAEVVKLLAERAKLDSRRLEP